MSPAFWPDLPDQLVIALRAREPQPEPARAGRNRSSTVAADAGKGDAKGAAPRVRVREVGELDGAGFLDRFDLGGRRFGAFVVDQAHDPRWFFGLQVVPLVVLRI